MKVENTNCVLVEKDGKVLLVRRLNITFHGWWCLPGGHAEKGESMAQAAQREIDEEVGGIKLEKEPFMVFLHDWPAEQHTNEPHKHRCHVYRGRMVGEMKAGSDAGELRWFTPEEAKNLKLTNYTEKVLNKLYE
jgi:ADP-ribose pyrophosphatase YjhB (NUDIX family)